jgi:hypothetical protein
MKNDERVKSIGSTSTKERYLIRISPHLPMKNIEYFDDVNNFVRAVDTSATLLPNEVRTALILYKNGVRSDRFFSSISESSGLLNERDKDSLSRVVKILKTLEESDSKRTKTLRSLNNNPDKITFNKYQEGQPQPQGNNLIIERSEEGELKVASETYQTSNIDKSDISLERNKNILENFVGESISKYKESHPPIESEITYDTPASYRSYVQRIVASPPEVDSSLEEPLATSKMSGNFGSSKSSVRQGAKKAGAAAGAAIGNAVAPVIGTALGKVGAWVGDLAGQAITDPVAFLKRMAKYAAIAIAYLAAVATSWLIEIIIGIFLLIFIVIIILFIINSGAYIVPPGGFTQRGENAYIRVTKTADPSGPFDNSWNNQNRTINYTITIYALQGSLTDISFNYTCSVISDNQQRCPDPSPNMPPSTPSIITASEPFVITYHTTLRAGGYYDSLITDTFSITATVNGERTTASGSKSIIIGNPPLGCFELTSDFPDNYASVLNAAIATITANHPGYVAKLCEGGTILIGWGQGIVAPYYCGWHVHGSLGGGVDIYLNANCLQDPDNAEFIVGHESGHHFASVHPDIYSLYELSPAYNDIICSYPLNPHPKSEDFAETIGMYINDNTRGATCFGNNFCSSYPRSCQFARGTIFSE